MKSDLDNKLSNNSGQIPKKSQLINGEYYTVKEAAELTGISVDTYKGRIYGRNFTAQEAFDIGKYGKTAKKFYLINGKYYTVKEAAELTGINVHTFKSRLQKGKTPQEAYEMGEAQKQIKKNTKQ